jgi:hypothetical protein
MAKRANIWFAVLIAACSDAPEVGPVHLGVFPERLDVSSLNTPGQITVYSSGNSTNRPRLSVLREIRWVPDRPVLDSDSLARGRIYARAPGEAVLKVEAFGGSTEYTVRVTHPRPVVFGVEARGAVGVGDTITLIGYRVNDNLGVMTLGDAPLDYVGGDSIRMRVSVGASARGVECVRQVNDTLKFSGADVAIPLLLPRRRADQIQLQIGEARMLTAAEQNCLILPGATRYALAFLDARRIEQSRNPRNTWQLFGNFAAGLTVPDTTGSLKNVMPRHGATLGDVVVQANAAADPANAWERDRPWVLNEEFDVRTTSSIPIRAKVHRIYDNHFVLAAQSDFHPDSLRAHLAKFDTTFNRFLRDTEPLYRRWFADRRPRTSAASGQLLVVVKHACGGGFAHRSSADPSAPSSWITMDVCGVPVVDDVSFELTPLHELAHVWQFEYLHTFAPFSDTSESWALEGGADYAVAEAMRRRAGLPIDGNWEWASSIGTRTAADGFSRLAWLNTDFTAGYKTAGNFLQHLIVKRIRAGMQIDEANAFILRASLQNWYGQSFTHRVASGFVAEMQSVEPGWDPAAAILKWTLSIALDELTANPELQNLTYRNVRNAHPSFGWPAIPVNAPQDRRVLMQNKAGEPFFLLLNNENSPATYVLFANVPNVKWMIARY